MKSKILSHVNKSKVVTISFPESEQMVGFENGQLIKLGTNFYTLMFDDETSYQLGMPPDAMKRFMTAVRQGIDPQVVDVDNINIDGTTPGRFEPEWILYQFFFNNFTPVGIVVPGKQAQQVFVVNDEAFNGPSLEQLQASIDAAGEDYHGPSAEAIYAMQQSFKPREGFKPDGKMMDSTDLAPIIPESDCKDRYGIDVNIISPGHVLLTKNDVMYDITVPVEPVAPIYTLNYTGKPVQLPEQGLVVISTGNGMHESDVPGNSVTTSLLAVDHGDGTLIEAPAHAITHLKELGIVPGENINLTGVHISHTHADHNNSAQLIKDNPLLQYIGSRITWDSLSRIGANLIGESIENFQGRFGHPLFVEEGSPLMEPVNQSVYIKDMIVNVHSNVSMATLWAFETPSGKEYTIAYMSDTPDPERLELMVQQGHITKEWAQRVLDFPKQADLILIEVGEEHKGFPPILHCSYQGVAKWLEGLNWYAIHGPFILDHEPDRLLPAGTVLSVTDQGIEIIKPE